MMNRVLVLGAGFGGLELSTVLSEALADEVEVTLIDKADSFVFGYSKLDVMFGHATPEAVRLPYREFVKPGVRLLQETITADRPRRAARHDRRGHARGRCARRRARGRLRFGRDARPGRFARRVLLL